MLEYFFGYKGVWTKVFTRIYSLGNYRRLRTRVIVLEDMRVLECVITTISKCEGTNICMKSGDKRTGRMLRLKFCPKYGNANSHSSYTHQDELIIEVKPENKH